MLKKFLTLAVVGAALKVALDKMQGGKEADLWAEATDSVPRS